MAIYVEAVRAEIVPTGKYTATVDRVELDGNSQYGNQIKWVFKITDGKYAGRELYAWSAYRDRATERSKLVRWYTAIMGGKPTGKFDVQRVVGKECVIVVVERTREDGSVVSKVDDVQPYQEPDPFE